MRKGDIPTPAFTAVAAVLLLLCSPGAEALQNEALQDTTVKNRRTARKTQSRAPLYGFASACELEVVKFYCHIAPSDPFCARGLDRRCSEIKDQCKGFRTPSCDESQPCCECAFSSCPLAREGCNLIMEKCGRNNLRDMDDNGFFSYVEIAKMEGIVKPGKVPIRINRSSLDQSRGSPSSSSSAASAAAATPPAAAVTSSVPQFP